MAIGIGTAMLLGAGASLLGSGLNYGSVQSTNAANKELAKYQYDLNLEMWNKQNEYNSPAKQMERLKAAGLNPNLVYGNGSVVGNTSGQMPKYEAPQLQAYQGFQDAAMNAYSVGKIHQETLRMQEEMDVMRASKNKLDADTALTKAKIITEGYQAGLVSANSAAQKLQNGVFDSRWRFEQQERTNAISLQLENISLNKLQQATEKAKARNISVDTYVKNTQAALNILQKSINEWTLKRQEIGHDMDIQELHRFQQYTPLLLDKLEVDIENARKSGNKISVETEAAELERWYKSKGIPVPHDLKTAIIANWGIIANKYIFD